MDIARRLINIHIPLGFHHTEADIFEVRLGHRRKKLRNARNNPLPIVGLFYRRSALVGQADKVGWWRQGGAAGDVGHWGVT